MLAHRPAAVSKASTGARISLVAPRVDVPLAIVSGLSAALITLAAPSAGLAKANLLDLPACSNFKQAGELQYCEVQKGNGAAPIEGDIVVLDYTARAVTTGKVYDGSSKFKFTLGNEEVIPGWELGILGNDKDLPAIEKGGIRTVLIPPQLAYGTVGDGCLFGLPDSCRIPPNSPVEITFKYKGTAY